ncbi:MAG: methyltransferase [Candidatus Diapherotrites archaeon]|nr:methyltransferase [Candidatus Diapherotrites archaeon]
MARNIRKLPKAREPAKVRGALYRLYKDRKGAFVRLFLAEEEVALGDSAAAPLLGANLIRRASGGRYAANVRIWKIKGKFIVTDLFTYTGKLRIYPVFVDESDFLAQNLFVERGDEVLDIGTGSGVQAICCAEKARMVVATDINRRALAFAGFNAKLNAVDGKIKFVYSNLFENLGKKRFDLIVSNPPFMPVPQEKSWFLHGSAGYDGLDVVRRILKDSKKHLKPKGRLQIITHSFGSLEKIQALEFVKKYFPESRVQVIHVLSPKRVGVEKYFAVFSDSEGFDDWKKFLEKNWLDYLYRVVINIFPAKKFCLEEIQNGKLRFFLHESFNQKPFMVSPYYSGGWSEMIRRYGDTSAFFRGEKP